MFKIENQASGKRFSTRKNESILAAALRAGVNLPYGCQKGSCGKCMATIIEGEVVYQGEIPNAISTAQIADRMALLCQCQARSDVVLVATELDDAADIEVKILPCKVDSINHLNADVVQLFLKIPDAESLQYLAGQYLDLIHPDFEPRAFSIANAPQNSSLIELHIRLVEDGKFTNFIFNQLEEKSLLKLEGPKGSFYFKEDSKLAAILIAGGTGFGPVKAIVEHAIAIGQKREMWIYWGARDEADLYMDLPAKWAKEYNNIHFVAVLSEPNSNWQGRRGFVHNSVLEDFNDLADFDIYACGPPIMIDSIAKTFTKKGMLKTNFFSDAFEFAETL